MIFTVASLLTTDFVYDSNIIIPVAYLLTADYFVHYFHLLFVVMLSAICLLAADLVVLHFCLSLSRTLSQCVLL